jgi:hypothetical protein
MTFTQIGAFVGLVTGIFTVFDRLIVGRPLTTISTEDPKGYRARNLRFENVSKHDLLIRRIRSWPAWLSVAPDDSVRGIITGVMRGSFGAILPPGETRHFPITVKKGELVDKDSNAWAPFVIVVSWRKSRSVWLPQVPVVIFSSARTLRRLSAAI